MLDAWAARWGVSDQAMADLRELLGASDRTPTNRAASNERIVSDRVRLVWAQRGAAIWRNNVGATLTATKQMIRYGLANDSHAMNQHIKSSDLIGIKPNGQFLARECKASNWKYQGTEREQAQLRFITLVVSLGGDAKFTTGDE